jgi:hypothetical protein
MFRNLTLHAIHQHGSFSIPNLSPPACTFSANPEVRTIHDSSWDQSSSDRMKEMRFSEGMAYSSARLLPTRESLQLHLSILHGSNSQSASDVRGSISSESPSPRGRPQWYMAFLTVEPLPKFHENHEECEC